MVPVDELPVIWSSWYVGRWEHHTIFYFFLLIVSNFCGKWISKWGLIRNLFSTRTFFGTARIHELLLGWIIKLWNLMKSYFCRAMLNVAVYCVWFDFLEIPVNRLILIILLLGFVCLYFLNNVPWRIVYFQSSNLSHYINNCDHLSRVDFT